MEKFDFKISENGDFLEDNLKDDTMKVFGDDLIKQICINRIKSVTKDWFNTNIGANLEEYFGKRCDKSLCNTIKSSIVDSLSFDSFIKSKDIFVIPSFRETEIKAIIFIKRGDSKSLEIFLNLDLVGEVKIK